MTASVRTKFALKSPSIALDERVHAARGDLADLALAGQLFVPHYALPMAMQCAVPKTEVRGIGKANGRQVTELLFGETFMVVDIAGGWAWGYCQHDHYVGYVEENVLCESTGKTASVVTVREACVYEAPDLGTASNVSLPMGAKVSGDPAGDFVKTGLGYISASALDRSFNDAASVAEALLDVPYHWGGRSGQGIDCSGLIQLSLALSNGPPAPRDSDQQQSELGTEIPGDTPLMRNDIIFFPGHVGIMADENTLLHATMHYGKTVAEGLDETIARIAKEHGKPVLARKRIGR
jgi:NlpC/P60 family/Bacterial dipeptidyl-peptidase Sh3 domain